MSYSYNYDSYPRDQSYVPSKEKSDTTVFIWFIVLVGFIIGIFKQCQRNFRVREEERAIERFSLNNESQQVPTVTIISELSNRPTSSRPTPNELHNMFSEYEIMLATELSLQLLRNGPPQTSHPPEPIAPPRRNDSVPKYEHPPNYEEALTLLNSNQNKLNRDTPIT